MSKIALLFAVLNLCCLTGNTKTMAQQQATPGMTTVVQMSYYAQPGKEEDVLNIRLLACEVLEKKTASPVVAS